MLQPVPLTNGIKDCLLGCNLSSIIATGEDPCRIGDVHISNSPMRCYDVGPGMAGGWGVCGYNCTAFHASASELTPCTKDDIGAGKCLIYCDSRTFPNKLK